MSDGPLFPENLLQASNDEKIHYFKDKKWAHPHLKNAFVKVKMALDPSNPYLIIFVSGPTGAGKTTLCQGIVNYAQEEAAKKENPGIVPVGFMEAIAPSSGIYDWKDHHKHGLLALDEPLVDHKTEFAGPLFNRGERKGSYLLNKNPSTMDLMRAMQSCLIHRKPLAFIIDEAQHLTKLGSGKRLSDQMDAIKSLANTSGVKHLLVGTYEMLRLGDLSGQLNRRTTEIHLPRYRETDEAEREEFLYILSNMERNLPLLEQPVLTEQIDFIFSRTFGCVGILKDWLTMALHLSLSQKARTLSLKHLEETAMSDRQLLRIAREIKEGELIMHADLKEELRSLRGVPLNFSDNEAEHPIAHSKAGRRTPGLRNPVRDPVGENPLTTPSENRKAQTG